jgi:hypothetical protein
MIALVHHYLEEHVSITVLLNMHAMNFCTNAFLHEGGKMTELQLKTTCIHSLQSLRQTMIKAERGHNIGSDCISLSFAVTDLLLSSTWPRTKAVIRHNPDPAQSTSLCNKSTLFYLYLHMLSVFPPKFSKHFLFSPAETACPAHHNFYLDAEARIAQLVH